jgi:hypothetical protein
MCDSDEARQFPCTVGFTLGPCGEQGESTAAFVDRVQRAIAGELRVPIYEMTYRDKRKLVEQKDAA